MNDAEGNLIYQAKLKEDALDLDPTSKEGSENAPPFHGYSKAGKAEGQLVYAHVRHPRQSHITSVITYRFLIEQSGTVEDFKRLKENGVDMTGKIALVRYGGNFRGLKVKAAQDAGAVGE